MKELNRNAVLSGIMSVINDITEAERQQKIAAYRDSLEMDERILVLRSLIELHPSLTAHLEKTIEAIKADELFKQPEFTYSYGLSYSAREILTAKLELMTDDEIRKYSLEELASLLKS